MTVNLPQPVGDSYSVAAIVWLADGNWQAAVQGHELHGHLVWYHCGHTDVIDRGERLTLPLTCQTSLFIILTHSNDRPAPSLTAATHFPQNHIADPKDEDDDNDDHSEDDVHTGDAFQQIEEGEEEDAEEAENLFEALGIIVDDNDEDLEPEGDPTPQTNFLVFPSLKMFSYF
jgi:hypothetical protein